MSAVYTILLLILITVSTAVLLHLRGLSRRLDAQAAAQAAPVPVDEAAIRQAVAEALAADREREITEARAFWAEQEARAAEDAPLFDSPFTGVFASTDEWPLFFPAPPARRTPPTTPAPWTRSSARRCAPRWRT